jgi:hypothetical protein
MFHQKQNRSVILTAGDLSSRAQSRDPGIVELIGLAAQIPPLASLGRNDAGGGRSVGMTVKNEIEK